MRPRDLVGSMEKALKAHALAKEPEKQMSNKQKILELYYSRFVLLHNLFVFLIVIQIRLGKLKKVSMNMDLYWL